MCFSGTKMQNRHLFAHFIMKNLAIDFLEKNCSHCVQREEGCFGNQATPFYFLLSKGNNIINRSKVCPVYEAIWSKLPRQARPKAAQMTAELPVYSCYRVLDTVVAG